MESERTANGSGNRPAIREPSASRPLAYTLAQTRTEAAPPTPIRTVVAARPEPVVEPVAAPIVELEEARVRRQFERRQAVTGLLAAGLVVALVVVAMLWSQVGTLRSHVHDLQRADKDLVTVAGHQAAIENGLSSRVSGLEARARAVPAPAAVAKKVRASVFVLETAAAQGSAWTVASSGGTSTLVTDFHVVSDTWNKGGRSVTVKQSGATLTGTITRVDTADDLALITVHATFPALARASAVPHIGDSVLVVGAPLGLDESVTSGIVSAERTQDGHDYLQFSAPISPGNSGGPVVDDKGRVVGVTVAKFTSDDAEGLSLAVPVAHICSGLKVC